MQKRRETKKTLPISRTPNGSNSVLKGLRKQQSNNIGKLLDSQQNKLPKIGDILQKLWDATTPEDRSML
jgi:hypothetical protein